MTLNLLKWQSGELSGSKDYKQIAIYFVLN
jgi:hypothetical protein